MKNTKILKILKIMKPSFSPPTKDFHSFLLYRASMKKWLCLMIDCEKIVRFLHTEADSGGEITFYFKKIKESIFIGSMV